MLHAGVLERGARASVQRAYDTCHEHGTTSGVTSM